MRFIDDRVELADDETGGIIILSLLGTILAFFTYGFTLALIVLGLYYYYTSEKEKASKNRMEIQRIAEQFEPTRNKLLELNLYEYYLTTPETNKLKQSIHITLENLMKYKPEYDHIIDDIIGLIFSYHFQIDNHNENYIVEQKERHYDFFSGEAYHGGRPFNEGQIRAILTNDIDNLIIAGPGAGKTRVLTSRVAFFVNQKGIAPEDILVLAYNRRAVREIKNRLKQRFGIENVMVSTFHSLGSRTIRRLTGTNFDVEKKGKSIIKKIVDELVLSDYKFQTKYLSYVNAWSIPDDLVDLEPEQMDEKFRHRLHESYRALDRTKVASIAERDIANYFIQYGISFEYEQEVTWCTHDIPGKKYKPDFYLPDYDTYLEHWAVSSTSRTPDFFSIEDSRKYLGNMCWKRKQFQDHNKTLWETNDTLFTENKLISTLEQKLENIGVRPQRLSYSKLLRKIGLQPDVDQAVRYHIADAIKTAKVYGLSPESLAWHIQSSVEKQKKRKQVQFLVDIVVPVFEHYETHLENNGKIDYEDMINDAISSIENFKTEVGKDTLIKPYRMIFVDEFQDISQQRLQLLHAYQNLDSDCRLFCVGDDWQAIYGFAGSSSRHMIRFKNSSSALALVVLEQNYRNPPKILEFSIETINRCSKKIDKDLIARPIETTETRTDFLVFKRFTGLNKWDFKEAQNEDAYQEIENLIESGIDPSEILVLSRFSFGYEDLQSDCLAQNIPVELSAANGKVYRPGVRFLTIHKSKGLEAEYVLLLNTFKGVYGLPSEIKPKIEFDIINPDLPESLDEERRLLFVATTRAKNKCIVYTWNTQESEFLVENEHFLNQFKVPEIPEFKGKIINVRGDSYDIQAFLSPSFRPIFNVGKSQVTVTPIETEGDTMIIRLSDWVYNRTYRKRWENLTAFS